jgi:SAM-dependent methyltransferase
MSARAGAVAAESDRDATALLSSTFRDPSGSLVSWQGRLLRLVRPDGVPDLLAFLDSRVGGELLASGRVVPTRAVEIEEPHLGTLVARARWSHPPALVLEHDRLPFVSVPAEWAPEMLLAAGRLTLELAESLLDEGLGLKDATPYNVVFRGTEPVFVDLLSFERRRPGDHVWLPYGQFVRAFLLPLLAHKHFGLSLRGVFLASREGLDPGEFYRICGPLRRLDPTILTTVTLPRLLARRGSSSAPAPAATPASANGDPERARFILRSVLRGLRRKLEASAPDPSRASIWTEYASCDHQTDAYVGAKECFVSAVLESDRPRSVLDVGCNTGNFSALAARSGARVVAIDGDAAVVGRTWARSRAESLDVLPLVVNLAQPTPPLGWCNAEWPGLIERSEGSFDLVLLLAVIHHLMVGEMIPLDEIVDLVERLTTSTVIVEYVPPDDPMFRAIARGREGLFRWLDRESFERAWGRHFRLVASEPVGGGSRRHLYAFRKGGEASRGA